MWEFYETFQDQRITVLHKLFQIIDSKHTHTHPVQILFMKQV